MANEGTDERIEIPADQGEAPTDQGEAAANANTAPVVAPAPSEALSQDLIERLLAQHLESTQQSEPPSVDAEASAATIADSSPPIIEPESPSLLVPAEPAAPALETEPTSDRGDALTQDLIEELLAKTIAEMEGAPPSESTTPAAEVVQPKPTDAIADMAEPASVEPAPTEASAAPAETAAQAAAPATKPPVPGPKPKIDFAALRRSRDTATQVNSAQVARLFGGPATDAPPPAEAKPVVAPAPAPRSEPARPVQKPRAPVVPLWERRLVDAIWQFRQDFPLLWRGCEWLGIILALHGVLILTLALLGWI